MNAERETGMAVIVGGVIILIIALSALFSCTTKEKVVTEYVTVHDTLVTHHSDTIRDVKVVTHTDTIRQVEWHNITLSQAGDTIKEVHHYYDTQKTIIVDSTNRYKVTVDSLRAALTQAKDKYKEMVKTRHVVKWWEWPLIVGIVLALLYGAKKMRV